MGGANFFREIEDPANRVARLQAGVVDVGDQVAVGVGVMGLRAKRQIGRQAVRGRQAGAFADEQTVQTGPQAGAKMVENADASMVEKKWTANRPATFLSARDESR